MSRRSVARAAEFSWDESARQLVDVARDIVATALRRSGKLPRLKDVHAVQPELHRFVAPLGGRGGLCGAQYTRYRPGLAVGKEQQGADVVALQSGRRADEDHRCRTAVRSVTPDPPAAFAPPQ